MTGSFPHAQRSVANAAAGKAVGSLIVQYEETDWEFLQRVLSREGIMITPDCRQPGLKLYAGVPELVESAFPCHILDMEKDVILIYDFEHEKVFSYGWEDKVGSIGFEDLVIDFSGFAR